MENRIEDFQLGGCSKLCRNQLNSQLFKKVQA